MSDAITRLLSGDPIRTTRLTPGQWQVLDALADHGEMTAIDIGFACGRKTRDQASDFAGMKLWSLGLRKLIVGRKARQGKTLWRLTPKGYGLVAIRQAEKRA